MQKHLKPKQYYIDLYDRHTVEQCRRTEQIWNEQELSSYDDKKLDQNELARVKLSMFNLHIHFKTGERYLNKEKTIQEWMDADEKRDDLYESTEAPEGIRCLTCRNLLKPTLKEFWSDLNKPDRVLFMYECQNKCLPHRAFFSDGEEWRIKLDLCPQCNQKLNQTAVNTNDKLTTTYTCSACSYTKTDELKWSFKTEEPLDENFATDRDRFCLTEEQGKKFQDEKWRLEELGKFTKKWEEENKAREEKLKENPAGFHLEGKGYTCPICGQSTPEGDNWYDQWGVKCLVCQKAIDMGEIPASIAKDRDSWYTRYDFQSLFNVKGPTLDKWVRHGIIQARTVSYYGKGIHTQVFLIEDNKDFLPPKKLTESQSTRTVKDGQTWHSSEPWYKFVNPKEHLKGYKIIDYLKLTNNEPTQRTDLDL